MTVAKSQPIFAFTCTCRRPGCVISTGFSAVQILVPGSLMTLMSECSVVVLPEPGRARREDQPVGLADDARACAAARRRASPSLRDRQRLGRGQEPHHDVFEAVARRHGHHAQLEIERAELPEVDAPVLRAAALGDVEARHDLQARDRRAPEVVGQPQVFGEQAVVAEADDDALAAAVRFDVDVGRAAGVRVHDDLVHEPDERVVRLLDRLVLRVGVDAQLVA